MARQLNQREKRILVIAARSKLDDVAIDEMKQAGLLSIVPAAETPQLEEKQKFLFRDRLHEQLKKAGIKTEPLTILAARRKKGFPYKILRIKCRAKCKFDQLLGFLAALPENPYLVGIEELRIECDAKQPADKRKDVEIDLTVSTFVQPATAEKAG
ncbi:MAG: hypothetical protein ACYTAS_21480 [Planctomycetota bacterium]|jgi:hypothetical protein